MEACLHASIDEGMCALDHLANAIGSHQTCSFLITLPVGSTIIGPVRIRIEATSLFDCRGMICQAFSFIEGMIGKLVRCFDVNVTLRDRYGQAVHRWNELLVATPKGGVSICLAIPCMQLSWRFWFAARYSTLTLRGHLGGIVWLPRKCLRGRKERARRGIHGMVTFFGSALHFRDGCEFIFRVYERRLSLDVFDSSPCPKSIRGAREGFDTTVCTLYYNEAGAFMAGVLSPRYAAGDNRAGLAIEFCATLNPAAVGAVCNIVKQGGWCVDGYEPVDLASFGTRLGDPVMLAEYLPQPDLCGIRLSTPSRRVFTHLRRLPKPRDRCEATILVDGCL